MGMIAPFAAYTYIHFYTDINNCLVEGFIGLVGLGECFSDAFTDIPDANGQDVAGVCFSEDDDGGLASFLCKCFIDCEAGGVVTTADFGVGGAPFVEFVAIEDGGGGTIGVPGGVGVPGFDEFVLPFRGNHEDDPAVVILFVIVESDFIDPGVCSCVLQQIESKGGVYGGDAPAGGDKSSVFINSECTNAEGALYFGDFNTIFV